MRTQDTIRAQKTQPKKPAQAETKSKTKRSRSEEAKVAKDIPPTFSGKNGAKVSQSTKGKKASQSEEKVIQQNEKPYQMMPKKPSSAYVCFASEFIRKLKASGNFT